MYTNRLLTLLAVIALLAVAALVVREAQATTALVEDVDSATRSYIALAAEVESSKVESATHSYIAQAKAVFCNADPSKGQELDSATRSYLAWAKAVASAC